MSKTFRMPEGVNPVRVSINNQEEQFFEAGKVYTVDDDVYALIESNLRVMPKESDEVQPVLPGARPEDAGKCAIVGEDGRYTLGLPEGLD